LLLEDKEDEKKADKVAIVAREKVKGREEGSETLSQSEAP